jgi:hypothetical protein
LRAANSATGALSFVRSQFFGSTTRVASITKASQGAADAGQFRSNCCNQMSEYVCQSFFDPLSLDIHLVSTISSHARCRGSESRSQVRTSPGQRREISTGILLSALQQGPLEERLQRLEATLGLRKSQTDTVPDLESNTPKQN